MSEPASRFEGVRKVLVIKLRHIGDVLLTVPVFRALRETFPGSHIAALVNSGTEEVLAGNPLVDEVLVFDRGIKGLNPLSRLAREASFLRSVRAGGFDMTVDLTSGDRAALISLASGARYRLASDPGGKGFAGKKRLYTHLAPHPGPRDRRGHMVLQNLAVVRHFGIDTRDLRVDFFIPDEARASARRALDEAGVRDEDILVHVHPTSRWLFKCWRDEHTAQVIDWLSGQGARVAVTSSPSEREMERARGVMALVKSTGVVDLCGRTSIKELAAVSERADAFFGVDSAPMHIAAAVGTPVVALFGPTWAPFWGPWDNGGPETQYAARSGLQVSGDHTVLQEGYECVPCGMDGCGGSKRSRCLEDISPEEVKRALAEKLRKKAAGSGGPGGPGWA
ncbi:MAG: glycosyltransferase family 9 protein [Thermodesulfovibrionales bacterium]